MKKDLFYQTIIIIALLLANFIMGCEELSRESECENNLDILSNSIQDFYKSSDTLTLVRNLENLEGCRPKPNLVHAKVQVLSLLKKCDFGIEYVSNLGEESFQKPYKRVLFRNLFRICKDSVRDVEYLNEIVKHIKIDLLENSNDADTWYDLINIKSEVLTREELTKEIREMTDTIKNNRLKKVIRLHPNLSN